jgi:uncharacterized phage-associated protein
MMTTASHLAKHLIAAFAARGEPITNLKLQKLLYYSQAWSLALSGKSLFTDRIEAWVHGPVVPSVFREYREFKWSPLVADCDQPAHGDVIRHVDRVLAVYGKFDASQLERMTHNEDPWRNARTGLAADEASNREITAEAMRKYYSTLLNG